MLGFWFTFSNTSESEQELQNVYYYYIAIVKRFKSSSSKFYVLKGMMISLMSIFQWS